MSSRNNYLKYKEKYLNLKKKYLFSQIGGNPPEVNDLIHYIDPEYRPDIKKIIWKIDTKDKYNIHVYNILNPTEQITLGLCNEHKEWKKLVSGTFLLHGLEGSDITRIFKILSIDGENITLLNKDGIEIKNTTTNPQFSKFQIYTDITELRSNKHFFPDEDEDEFGALQTFDIGDRFPSASSYSKPYYSGSQRDASALDWGWGMETVVVRPGEYSRPDFSSSSSSAAGSSSSSRSYSLNDFDGHRKEFNGPNPTITICTVPGRQANDRSPFRVIPNSGSVRDLTGEMELQCFWISIFDYLQRNSAAKSGRKIDSVRELRSLVGLQSDTENTMFDEDNPIMKRALQNLIEVFNLRIVIHPIKEDGSPIILPNHLHGGELEACYEFRGIVPDESKTVHIVHITQHLQYHFQLIVSDEDQSGYVAGTKNHFLLDKQVVDLSDHQEAAGILEGWNSASTEIRFLEQDLSRLLEGQDKTHDQEVKILSIIERIDDLRRQLNEIGKLGSAPGISALQTKTGQINEETEKLIAQYGHEDFSAREQLGKLDGFGQEEFGARPQTPAARKLGPFKVGEIVYITGRQALVEGDIPEFTSENPNFGMTQETTAKARSAIETPTILYGEISGEVSKVDKVGDKYYYIISSSLGWVFNVVENITLYEETA
jgi:hypothetical protein